MLNWGFIKMEFFFLFAQLSFGYWGGQWVTVDQRFVNLDVLL